ncbi:hypothetical protein C8J57DRAFT_1510505 [Mycena rebaudengoi]|nr:hypothetical protein C8J57DRAFT_1510505 [Mycena rebaudengoi]
MQLARHLPTGRADIGRGVLARLRQRIKKILTVPATFPEGPRRLFPYDLKTSIDLYIAKYVLEEKYAVARLAAEATVESITLFRHTVTFGRALLICRLRLPDFPDTSIALLLERLADTGGDSSSSVSSSASFTSSSTRAADSVVISTEKSDAELIGRDYQVFQTLKFPRQSPNFVDVLALVKLVSQRHPACGSKNHSCLFYVVAVYTTLDQKFAGHSKKGPGYNQEPNFLGIFDEYKAEFKLVVDSFGTARSDLRDQIELLQFKEAEHDALRKIAAAQDAQIAANERRITAQEALIAVREAQIATREAQIATRQTQNATQEARIAALEGPLIWEETGIHTVQVLQRSSSNEGRLDA